MKVFEANITYSVIDFFEKSKELSFEDINEKLKSISGINTFFKRQYEFDELTNTISIQKKILKEPDRSEYGDFQTNKNLSDKICGLLKKNNINPEIIVEPTCGKGNFIISSIRTFNKIKYIYGIEIYKPYVWETKFQILDYFLNNPKINPPEIDIFHYDVFDFNFKTITEKHKEQKILILGNPPWVTNSKLSSLGSNNLPHKSNFKNHNGFDAITGKGNFDIGEYISIKLISVFSEFNGHFAFLVKNSVVKNILLEQNKTKYRISNIRQYNIDAKKEFNVSVNACLFLCSFNNQIETTINEYDFYSEKLINKYGWCDNKFVANLTLYQKSKKIDGKFPFEWRQGLKHDASKVMELEKINGHYINNKKETVDLEEDLVFGLLKSSDLKGGVIDKSRKYTIVTQTKVGQATNYIKYKYPKTYEYLSKNIDFFTKRKSTIYKGKPLFSIFGIGDYSFKPFKVAISGMYKTTLFSLVKPDNNKPIMLDDTCYFIGFDTLIEAKITSYLLNKDITQNFIKAIAFKDAKRMITKDLLMRIDLKNIIEETNFEELHKEFGYISIDTWLVYKKNLVKEHSIINMQLDLFETNTLHTTQHIHNGG
ncbi:MAG: hypothetical protein DRJ09_03275 [Bacteroidetes bacterium]|nr:MAG: hypothetical protein DRJ09_03275 [Bacteroidota bacterium]